MTSAWTLDVDADRIAWLTCDMPGSSTNVLSAAVIQDLAAALPQVAESGSKPFGQRVEHSHPVYWADLAKRS